MAVECCGWAHGADNPHGYGEQRLDVTTRCFMVWVLVDELVVPCVIGLTSDVASVVGVVVG